MTTPIQLSKSETWDQILKTQTNPNFSVLLTAIVNHLEIHRDESLETVEKRFRATNQITHLFAQSREERLREFAPDLSPSLERYVDPITKTEKKFALRLITAISDRNRQKIEELRNSPAGDIERLKQAGLPRAPSQIEAVALALFMAQSRR